LTGARRVSAGRGVKVRPSDARQASKRRAAKVVSSDVLTVSVRRVAMLRNAALARVRNGGRFPIERRAAMPAAPVRPVVASVRSARRVSRVTTTHAVPLAALVPKTIGVRLRVALAPKTIVVRPLAGLAPQTTRRRASAWHVVSAMNADRALSRASAPPAAAPTHAVSARSPAR
jgi:hypothetical protein